MKKNYARFGDVLSFDMLYGTITDPTIKVPSYQLGLFTVGDNNSRRLLAGIALISNESADPMVKMFKHFMIAQGKDPRTIFHAGRQTISAVIDNLKSDRFLTSSQLINPDYTLRHCELELNGSIADKNYFMTQLKKAANTRNLSIYEQHIDDLKRSNFRQLVEYLLRSPEKTLFYCESDPSVHVGLNLSSKLKEIEAIKLELLGDRGVIPLLNRIHKLDLKLKRKSETEFERHSNAYKVMLADNDKRLEEFVGRF